MLCRAAAGPLGAELNCSRTPGAVPRCSGPSRGRAELQPDSWWAVLLSRLPLSRAESSRTAAPGLCNPRSGALSVSVASESVGGGELGGLGSFLLLGFKDLIKIN